MYLFNHGIKYAIMQIDQRFYHLLILRRIRQLEAAPRLVIVSYLPNELAYHTLRVCVQAIQHFTPELHEIWVVDNHSPRAQADRLLELRDVNLVFNRTEPRPRNARYISIKSRQKNWGSYANAVALEIGIRLVDPNTQYLMTMHMDTMPVQSGWLSYLRGKLNEHVRSSGVRLDTGRVKQGTIHVLGNLVDFQLFRQLKLDFFPQLPDYDVGDRAIMQIRQAGFDISACPNSLWDGKLLDALPELSPFRSLQVDRSFDDTGNVIFQHLGRGGRKSSGESVKGATTEEWIQFADEYLLA